MPYLRRLAAFLLLMGFAAPSPATGPVIAPASPSDADTITLTAYVDPGGKNLCDLHLPVEATLTRNGTNLHIAYTVEARGPDSPPLPGTQECPSTVTPVPVVVELGVLPAGNYQAMIVGLTLGQPNPSQRLLFHVRGEGVGEDLPPPTVTPQPAVPDDELTLTAHVSSGGILGCDLHTPFETSLTRTGSTFQFNYAIHARGPDSPYPPCVLVAVPVRLTASLGTLPPGSYEVKVIGTTMGQPNPDQTVTFTVAGAQGEGGIDEPSPYYVPVGTPWGWVSMMCVLALFGAWRMHRS